MIVSDAGCRPCVLQLIHLLGPMPCYFFCSEKLKAKKSSTLRLRRLSSPCNRLHDRSLVISHQCLVLVFVLNGAQHFVPVWTRAQYMI